MSIQRYHGLCQRYRGKAVEIRTRDGRVHRGIIQYANNQRVFIRPIRGTRNLGGYGYGGYGYGYGFGAGFGYGIALGAITGLVLLPFFLW
ncbi:hypothetical protein [Pseudobacillus wudalianchiensis]|uniref:Uncharacterized protein n=1 Tax=Pseudobacillus wudalianchiensis TaxID=1743143 RepID=A0A1B9ATK3_9BACI|nr:hypothetical protein [Bacillus wudalianchiensis]OCA87255.1 hypothetical protein A8F95_08360 [Bacillus wudalianchiensis]